MHPERLDVIVNSLLFAILTVFQALVQSRRYNLITVKPWSTHQRTIGGLGVNNVEFGRRFQASALQVQSYSSEGLLGVLIEVMDDHLLIG
jgi:hypothetical protein